MSARSDLQQAVIGELEALGLVCSASLGRVQGRSGYSRDVFFEDVRVGFAGRLRIFSESFVTVSFGNTESERYDSPDDAVSAIVDAYQDVRGNDPVPPAYIPDAPLSLSPGHSPAAKGRPSAEAIEGVRLALLEMATQATMPEQRKAFAQMAVALGATAEELLLLVM